MKNGTIKRIIILIVFCIIMLANDNSVEAKDRKVEAIRIKEIKQDIDGREVYIKCGVKDCQQVTIRNLLINLVQVGQI